MRDFWSFLGFQEIKNTFAANCYCALRLLLADAGDAIKALDVLRRVCVCVCVMEIIVAEIRFSFRSPVPC